MLTGNIFNVVKADDLSIWSLNPRLLHWPGDNTRQPLLTPVRSGVLTLSNRMVMAPLTRMRAANPGLVPTELHRRYYEQRASAD